MATAARDIADTPTLDQLDTFFDRLSEESQLLLLDHLADRTDYADELSEGLHKAVIAFGEARGCDEFEAEALAEQVSYTGTTPTGLTAWRAERDRKLRHSLSWARERAARS